MTESEVVDMIRAKYEDVRYASPPAVVYDHVRNRVGQNASRTADAIAVSMWPSRGLEIVGFEVKCNRADWLREMRNPAKMEAFYPVVDRWWLVTANDSVAALSEVPETWGLLVVTESKAKKLKLDERRKAPLLPRVGVDEAFTTLGMEFLIALLRASQLRASEEKARALEQEASARADQVIGARDRSSEWKERELEDLRERVAQFERAAGVSLTQWFGGKSPADIGAALRLVLAGEVDLERIRVRARGMANQAQALADAARKLAE